MKIALCCIAKMENIYIREFLKYYFEMGVDKVFLYDNNDSDYEDVRGVIKDYIDSGFVDVTDIKDQGICLLPTYQDFWDRHHNDYDWMLYIDCDEYIWLNKDKNLKDYLSRDCFANYDMIHLNWLMMDDGGLVKSNSRPLLERCYPSDKAKIKDKNGFCVNFHIKSLIRGPQRNLNWLYGNPHTPATNNLRACDDKGQTVDNHSPFVYKDNNELAYIKHFHTKTIDEWINNKIPKGFCDRDITMQEIETKKLDEFFSICEKTDEKPEYIKNSIQTKQ